MSKRRRLPSGTLLIVAFAIAPAHAQMRPPSEAAQISSSPGKASAAATLDLTAKVTAVDKATRTITLQGPRGGMLDVMAGEEVRNFEQIRVGDTVVVRYRQALSLELRKSNATPGGAGAAVAARAAPGERPGGIVGREVQVTAEVVEVDPVRSIIGLKGPKGNVVELQVRNPDHFKVVKKGDYVDAVYSEALAIAVTPTPATGK